MAKLPAPTGAPLDLGGHVELYSDGIVDIERYSANSRLISTACGAGREVWSRYRRPRDRADSRACANGAATDRSRGSRP